MNARQQAFSDATELCCTYAVSLMADKPDWADVALECARLIDDERKLAPTITENGAGGGANSVKSFRNWINLPEIDYTSGLPRK